jgi:hypothetical protein
MSRSCISSPSWRLHGVVEQLYFTLLYDYTRFHISIYIKCCKVETIKTPKEPITIASVFHIVTNSQGSIHNGTLLHSKLNTQPLIAVHNASRVLTQI